MRTNTTKKLFALLVSMWVASSVLVGCAEKAYLPSKESVPRMKVLVYYPAGEGIVGEEHLVRKSNDIPRAALQELIQGKPNNHVIKSFIPKAKILSLRVENGLATVNFSREILNAKVNAEKETLGIAAIVRTLTEFKEIQKVKILVEGRESGIIGDRLIEDWWGNGGIKKQPFRIE